ncbi:MAG: cyclase family protein [Syntrophobacteraceae bacterium]
MDSEWIDVSAPIRTGMVHWPDNSPVVIERALDIERGDSANVSRISMGAHTGTHMDAPIHFLEHGRGIEELPLSVAIGRARVIEIENTVVVNPDELVPHKIRRGERVLFKTVNSMGWWRSDSFAEDFVCLSCEAAKYLVDRGVRMVGIDYLSVGGFKTDGAATHRCLLFCYDKRLNDRLASGTAEDVRLHLLADAGYQDKLLRFIENHDEPRAAAVFPPLRERAAALIVATLPGGKLFHDGQIEGRKIRVPVSLGRRPPEEPDKALRSFYHKLLAAAGSHCLKDGEWTLCERSGWPDNASWTNVLAWRRRAGEEKCLVAVNASDHRSQALIRIPWQDIGGAQWGLVDVLSDERFDRNGDRMQSPGLYVDLDGWNWHFLRFVETDR